jgi:hypothetical protein
LAFGLQSSPKLYDQVLPRCVTPTSGTFVLKGLEQSAKSKAL